MARRTRFRTAKDWLLSGRRPHAKFMMSLRRSFKPRIALVTPPSSPVDYKEKNEEEESSSSCQRGYLESLPRELGFLIAGYCQLEDVFSLAVASHPLRDNFILPYLSGLRRFILEEQEGQVKSLCQLLAYNSSLEAIQLDLKDSEVASFPLPAIWQGVDLLALCFRQVRPGILTTLIMKGCVEVSQEAMIVVATVFHNLTALDLSFMPNLRDTVLKKLLANNTHLVYLCLEKSYNAVNTYSLNRIGSDCPCLKTLSLSYCTNVDDHCLQYISQLLLLKELSLAHCYDISAGALATLAKRCSSLTILSLEWCFNLDDSVLDAIGDHCLDLQILGVEHCSKISDHCMAKCIHLCTQLRFLSIDGCNHVGLWTMAALSSRLHNLKDLFVNTCEKVDDLCVKSFLKGSSDIQSLGIEECSITDESLVLIAQYCPCLRVLGLNGNVKVSDKGVSQLVMARPNIMRLYLSDTAVTNVSVKAIAKHCRALLSLSLVGCEVDLLGLMDLGDPTSQCAYTLQDLHLSSTQFWNPFLQRPSEISVPKELIADVLKKNLQQSSYHSLLEESDDTTPAVFELDLRKIIFLDRLRSFPSKKLCRIYFR
eukprot:gene6299-6946_t